MKINMVFEGGGILGVSFIGAIKSLSQHGYKFQCCAGTSAGSIAAALVIAGYNYKEIDLAVNSIYKKYYSEFSSVKNCRISQAARLIKNKGIYDSSLIEELISPLLEAKGTVYFKDVMVRGKSRLKIVASDITRRDIIVLPDDLQRYGIDGSNFKIATAVRMSCSIPFFFTPYKLNYYDTFSYIVDGGLLSNFPIWIFEGDSSYSYPTFGLNLRDKKSKTINGKNGFIPFAQDVILAPLNGKGQRYIREDDDVRTIVIDVPEVKATDFKDTLKYSPEMIDNGFNATEEFLKHWRLEDYIRLCSNNLVKKV